MTGNCGDCAHWCRGTKTTFHERAVEFDGKPHRCAGTTQIEDHRWKCHGEGQDVGRCSKASPDDPSPMMVAVCWSEGIYGELITDARWGCRLFETAAEGWDHWEQTRYDQTECWPTVKARGEEWKPPT